MYIYTGLGVEIDGPGVLGQSMVLLLDSTGATHKR